MFTIRQNGDEWELLDAAGAVLSSHATYDLALGELSERLLAHVAQLAEEVPMMDDAAEDAAPADAGLLPEVWMSEMCFSEDTGDGRDFSNVVWSSRDPAVSTMPLMLQTETEFGHFGACLAGYITEVTLGGAPVGRGRFYDCDAGEQARDLVLGGRRFGVSVDPGAVLAEYVCTSMDGDGWCEEGIVRFDEYEIIGLTMTPFPAFAEAYITLDTPEPATAAEGEAPAPAPAVAPAARVAAAGAVAVRERTLIPTRPPLAWFNDPGLLMPTPLTITEQGHVLGHVAAWGTCHVGSDRVCVTPPSSQLAYRHFLTGEVLCDEGTRTPTGALTWGIPHADLNASLIMAQAHYADSRHGWADVSIGEDEHGIWIAGACRPQLNDDDLRVLRALALSGDWRHDHTTRDLELVAALAVNVPGFPIPRAVVASGRSIDQPSTRAGLGAGMQQTALVASGIVIPSRFAELTREPCGCSDSSRDEGDRLERIERTLARIDRRTAHLTGPAIDDLRTRLGLDVEPSLPPASYVPIIR